MKIAVDSSVFIDVEKREPDALHLFTRVRDISSEELCLPAPAYSEIYYGYLSRQDRAAIKRLDSFEILNTSRESSALLARIKKAAVEMGKPLPIIDLMIASIAIANGAKLITKDAHFKDIPGLDVLILD